MNVADAERFCSFSLPGLADQRSGDVDARHFGASPGEFAGDASVPAGDIQDPQPSGQAQQFEQRRGGRIINRVEPAGVELRYSVVPGFSHHLPLVLAAMSTAPVSCERAC